MVRHLCYLGADVYVLAGYAQLDKLCLRFRKIATQHQVVVILLNSVVKHAETDTAAAEPQIDPIPSLGRSFADLLDSSLLLLQRRTESTSADLVVVQVLKVLKQPIGMGRNFIAKFLIRQGYKLETLT